MKVYLCFDRGRWEEESELLGIYKQQKDAIDMCNASNLNPKHSIEEHEVIE